MPLSPRTPEQLQNGLTAFPAQVACRQIPKEKGSIETRTELFTADGSAKDRLLLFSCNLIYGI